MSLDQVEKIAEAVLYEGYMLYPYRPTSVKNKQRWNFGVLCPQSYSIQEQGSEAWIMQSECLLRTTPLTRVNVKVRFLQLVQRSIGRLRDPESLPPEGAEPEFDLVNRLEIDGALFQPWQEAVEREVTATALYVASPYSLPELEFAFAGGRRLEYLLDKRGQARGVMVREWKTVSGSTEFEVTECREGVAKVSARIRNITDENGVNLDSREAALMYSMISVHTILGVEEGRFISLLEPPDGMDDLVAECHNIGTWPVLVGDCDEAVLSSPIILYDHPQVAIQSAGNLFDSTEIDEILSLRILTLTDEEKHEMRHSDDRARQILERTENMPEEQLMKLHGVLRGLIPLEEEAL